MRRGLGSPAVLCGVMLLGILTGRGHGVAADGRAPAVPRSVTVPFTLDHGRMIVDVELTRPDGSVRRARAWVDIGNDALVLAEPLARDLGLELSALSPGQPGHSAASSSPAPTLRLGGMPLDVDSVPVRVFAGAHGRAGVGVEVQLPAGVLRHHHVVFDYPASQMTVTRPGARKPRGTAIPCRVNPATGLVMVAATLDGETVWLGVDNGSAGTWVSDTLPKAWLARHPEWPYATGAAGSANFFGFPFESQGTLMHLPELGLGPLRARDVTVLGLDQSMFDWYSKKSAGPVLGFIGANVLRGFRLEIDFPGQMTWWQAGPSGGRRDLDIVGLTLRPEPGGGTTITGVVAKEGRPVVEGVESGDRVIAVDGHDLATARMGEVVEALRGEPGAMRTLVLEQHGQRRTVSARVTRLP
jgi:hypothetical protein